jgi:hypothetical protein
MTPIQTFYSFQYFWNIIFVEDIWMEADNEKLQPVKQLYSHKDK